MTALAELIGDSPALVDVRAQVEQLLRRHSQTRRLPPVLMLGETGTGKGLLARALHDAGPRADGPFVAVNCMTLPETLMEAELFGFERGAFTGAHQAKAGLFQTAHRGTLFLDEIGLLPEQLQAKLLTAIENRSVRRLGSTRPEPVDVWIITATSEDIEGAARGRGFREELFHRIAVVTLRLPPLRERGDDILTLAGHFLARACREDGLTPKTLADDARTVLLGYRWPGNVRELSNQMRRAALLTDDPVVTADTLDLPAPRARRASPVSVEDDASGARTREATLDQAVRGAEGARILAMLDETRGNVSHAADRLGVTRNRLRYRMQKYGLQAASRPAEPTPLSEPVSGTEAPRAAPRRLHVQWERRHVALLRVDLVAPSAAVLDTTPVLETLVANVHKFGGQVDEVSPRGLVAAFGLEPVEDAVRRAAHAALAMQNIAGHDRVGPLSGVRLGLHVAEVLLGRFDGAARIDYAAKRDAWAALEAFMGSAEPGTVLVSEATRPFLERHFALASFTAGDATVGTVHRLSGLPRSGLGAGERLTPFVARGRELEHLAEALEHAVDGHGQVVGVIGEPGIGKSRLFWEFGRSLRLRNARLLVAGAASYGQSTPYLPVVDLLKAYFHIEARDTLEQIRKQVTAKALSLDQGLASTLPAILALLDVPVDDPHWTVLDASQKQRKTLEAVTRLLVEESRRQPVVIVFEDLHWIDAKTRELLDAFADRIPGHRVLLLLSYRPEYRHGWSSKSYYAQLRLDPLPPDDPQPCALILSCTTKGRAYASHSLVPGRLAHPLDCQRLPGAVWRYQ